MDDLKEDRIRRVMTGQSKRPPYVELCPHGPEMMKIQRTFYTPEDHYPEGYPLESIDEVLTFKPESVAHLISLRSVLFIHGERGRLVPVDEAKNMYAKAGHPKKLMIIPGVNVDLNDTLSFGIDELLVFKTCLLRFESGAYDENNIGQ